MLMILTLKFRLLPLSWKIKNEKNLFQSDQGNLVPKI